MSQETLDLKLAYRRNLALGLFFSSIGVLLLGISSLTILSNIAKNAASHHFGIHKLDPIRSQLVYLLGEPQPNRVEFPSWPELPYPNEFVWYNIPPTLIVDVTPEYPAISDADRVEVDIWIKVLIDKNGIVRDVIIPKDSGANAGFEEAAVEAARKTIWKPAIANGQPIAVWTIYRIRLRLR